MYSKNKGLFSPCRTSKFSVFRNVDRWSLSFLTCCCLLWHRQKVMAEGITKNSILNSYFKGRVREGVGEIFHPLGPSPSDCSGQGWARLRPGAVGQERVVLQGLPRHVGRRLEFTVQWQAVDKKHVTWFPDQFRMRREWLEEGSYSWGAHLGRWPQSWVWAGSPRHAAIIVSSLEVWETCQSFQRFRCLYGCLN